MRKSFLKTSILTVTLLSLGVILYRSEGNKKTSRYSTILYGISASPIHKGHMNCAKLVIEQFPDLYRMQKEDKRPSFIEDKCIYVWKEGDTFYLLRDDFGKLVEGRLPESLGGEDSAIKRYIAEAGHIDYAELFFIGTADTPDKPLTASSKDRLQMIALAVEDAAHPRIKASRLETILSDLIEEPSFTYNTLKVIREGLRKEVIKELEKKESGNPKNLGELFLEKHPNVETKDPLISAKGIKSKVFFMMGADRFNTFNKWRKASLIGEMAGLLVLPREGDPITNSLSSLSEVFSSQDVKENTFYILPDLHDTTSSTAVRKAIEEQDFTKAEESVSPSVLLYIQEQELYKRK